MLIKLACTSVWNYQRMLYSVSGVKLNNKKSQKASLSGGSVSIIIVSDFSDLENRMLFFYLLETANRMFFAAETVKMLRHALRVQRELGYVGYLFVPWQGRRIASLADFTARRTAAIPVPLTRLGLLLGVPSEIRDKVLVGYDSPAVAQTVSYSHWMLHQTGYFGTLRPSVLN